MSMTHLWWVRIYLTVRHGGWLITDHRCWRHHRTPSFPAGRTSAGLLQCPSAECRLPTSPGWGGSVCTLMEMYIIPVFLVQAPVFCGHLIILCGVLASKDERLPRCDLLSPPFLNYGPVVAVCMWPQRGQHSWYLRAVGALWRWGRGDGGVRAHRRPRGFWRGGQLVFSARALDKALLRWALRGLRGCWWGGGGRGVQAWGVGGTGAWYASVSLWTGTLTWGAVGAVWAGGGWCGAFSLQGGGGSYVRLRFLW